MEYQTIRFDFNNGKNSMMVKIGYNKKTDIFESFKLISVQFDRCEQPTTVTNASMKEGYELLAQNMFFENISEYWQD